MPHLPRTDTRRHGFTLLEMTVVIAIIGIVSGMVVAGRAYLYHAQLNQIMQDAQYYRAAFNQFEDKYVAVPGDMAVASTVWQYAKNGDGNGFIDAGTSNPNEAFFAFQHLANAGVIDGFFTGTAGATQAGHAIIGTNIPAGPLARSGYYFRDISLEEVPSGNFWWFAGSYTHPFFFGGNTNAWLPEAPIITPKEAQMIDTKYDDGMPGMGHVRTPHSGYLPNCVNSANAGSAQYLLAYKAIACTLIFTQP